jgi:hypothetical protein
MVKAFTQLERVLSLEEKQGYKNKAVVGGIRQFAAFWVTKARGEAMDEIDRALVEQIAEVLQGYARLPGAEARAETIDRLQQQLRQRQERLSEVAVAPAPRAPEPKRPARPPAPPHKAVSTAVPQPDMAQEPDPDALQRPVRCYPASVQPRQSDCARWI